MIKVIIGTNTARKTVMVAPDTKIKDILTQNDIQLGVGTVTVDGCPVTIEEMNSTLAELGITESVYILSVIKSDNAK